MKSFMGVFVVFGWASAAALAQTGSTVDKSKFESLHETGKAFQEVLADPNASVGKVAELQKKLEHEASRFEGREATPAEKRLVELYAAAARGYDAARNRFGAEKSRDHFLTDLKQIDAELSEAGSLYESAAPLAPAVAPPAPIPPPPPRIRKRPPPEETVPVPAPEPVSPGPPIPPPMPPAHSPEPPTHANPPIAPPPGPVPTEAVSPPPMTEAVPPPPIVTPPPPAPPPLPSPVNEAPPAAVAPPEALPTPPETHPAPPPSPVNEARPAAIARPEGLPAPPETHPAPPMPPPATSPSSISAPPAPVPAPTPVPAPSPPPAPSEAGPIRHGPPIVARGLVETTPGGVRKATNKVRIESNAAAVVGRCALLGEVTTGEVRQGVYEIAGHNFLYDDAIGLARLKTVEAGGDTLLIRDRTKTSVTGDAYRCAQPK